MSGTHLLDAPPTRRRGAGLLLGLVCILCASGAVTVGTVVWVSWQIYSCTTPGQPCYQEGQRRTAEVVAELDEQHDSLHRELDRLRQQINRLENP